MKELYSDKYGETPIQPGKVKEAIEKAHRAKLTGTSLVQDKNATPAEPTGKLSTLEKTLRPISLVAERSGKSASTAYEEHGNVLASYQTLDVQTGSTMLNNSKPNATIMSPSDGYFQFMDILTCKA